ncbi:unnamed protein product [Spirodela intermedia]|uniref:Gag1-like clamp domain-containing protein n=2 Tax=Spirodela intermedia TaxID=51605 RepID=A0A7I8J8L1_SPIIN|nr:unnamed protein product [Spirodela intermedia]CAA6666566.1 unnamed protein product [Spirodela intermedia]CAA7403363.1 unnamed protein product [Spirodela intermedia]
MESKDSNLASTKAPLPSGLSIVNEQEKHGDDNVSCVSFINHAEIAWHERRKEWVGDQSKKPHRMTKEPVISWSTTYEDLLSTNQHFPRRIALAEMVDFLVDIWHEDGLYD